ncbi:hypothetical protein SDC9_55906 [bioreactor metagenome]|uniref:Uncharacterized protein n=1 Tax=bioreactor metagenome TaxID=1076179 RepID=A0A644X0B1_9ZZZZ
MLRAEMKYAANMQKFRMKMLFNIEEIDRHVIIDDCWDAQPAPNAAGSKGYYFDEDSGH